MRITIYYCDICKKRIGKHQKVYFGYEHQYHFRCYIAVYPDDAPTNAKRLKEFDEE